MMRKLYVLSFVFALLMSSKVVAQDLDFKVGLNVATESEKTGLFLGAEYGLTPVIDLVAGISFFTPESNTYNDPFTGNRIKTRAGLWMFDINGNYNFPVGDGFTLYPLAGLNVTTVSWKVDNERDSDSELGVNIGGGASYDINDKLDAFLEVKYILGDFDQACLGLGVLLRLN